MMFSQLCRARRRTLWNKLPPRQVRIDEEPSAPCSPPANSIHLGDSQRINELDSSEADSHCHLIHCAFCDFRACCEENQENPPSDWEPEPDSPPPEFKGTLNPAYGLSSKIWLEINSGEKDEETVSSLTNPAENMDRDTSNYSEIRSSINPNGTSQRLQECDGYVKAFKAVNSKSSKYNDMNRNEAKYGTTLEVITEGQREQNGTWSVNRHKPISEVASAMKNCDNNLNLSVIERLSDSDKEDYIDRDLAVKSRRNIANDRAVSLMRPINKIIDVKMDLIPPSFSQPARSDIQRQKPVQKNGRSKLPNITADNDKTKRSQKDTVSVDPLAEIARIKTEESIQDWLARIGESANSTWTEECSNPDEDDNPKYERRKNFANNTDEEKDRCTEKGDGRNCGKTDMDKTTQHSEVGGSEGLNDLEQQMKNEIADLNDLLYNASKASPANIPMVIMQCSRLYANIGCKPPFQQASLPMGTLVTALYQESDWLYVQTPHGVEGFVIASNCVPIGTVNDPSQTSRRPWEPCDFPIQIRKSCEFRRQQGSYISTTLPTNIGKQAAPYVSAVKMKTNFYSDRYFSHTFKCKDSIKTAKTVTDILRSSPETKITNQ